MKVGALGRLGFRILERYEHILWVISRSEGLLLRLQDTPGPQNATMQKTLSKHQRDQAGLICDEHEEFDGHLEEKLNLQRGKAPR